MHEDLRQACWLTIRSCCAMGKARVMATSRSRTRRAWVTWARTGKLWTATCGCGARLASSPWVNLVRKSKLCPACFMRQASSHKAKRHRRVFLRFIASSNPATLLMPLVSLFSSALSNPIAGMIGVRSRCEAWLSHSERPPIDLEYLSNPFEDCKFSESTENNESWGIYYGWWTSSVSTIATIQRSTFSPSTAKKEQDLIDVSSGEPVGTLRSPLGLICLLLNKNLITRLMQGLIELLERTDDQSRTCPQTANLKSWQGAMRVAGNRPE